MKASGEWITAVVLAAGLGRRMGSATKQLLPWGKRTVLGQTLFNLQQSSAAEIVVVSGYEQAAVEAIAHEMGIATLFNPQFATGEMLSSLKTAVSQLGKQVTAVLVVLADQPMIEPATFDQIIAAHRSQQANLVAPQHNGQRGNPVLIGRPHFAELLSLPPNAAPRHLLQRHQAELLLVPMPTDTIHRDIDTPEAYKKWRPRTG